MKTINALFAGLLLTASVCWTQQANAQAPQHMSYQSVIRNSSNALVAATPVSMQISLLQGTASGTAVYVETQTATTNANGLVSIEIGTGTATTGTFSEIDWATGPYFIKTEIDPAGGSNYTITGTQQMASVPYALYAAKSGGTVFETTVNDPTAIHNTNAGNVGIGTDLPSEKLDVNGNVRIRGGNPAQGKVLTSDENGTASWQTPVTQSGTGGDTYWSLESGDLVTYLDVITRSNLGVGFDMTPGFDFGANTLVLRENNTRILFEDTSTSGTFPSKDWRLTANDQADGGDNYFSIDNITDALVGLKVKDSGTLVVPTPNAQLGIGTDSPQQSIHAKSLNTPSIRLEQDASGANPAQVWDIIGNESNMAIRDVTNASLLPLKIKPNSPTNSLVINSLGVGIGTESPSEKLDVNGNVNVRQELLVSGNSFVGGNSLVAGSSTIEQVLAVNGLAYINSIIIPGGNPAQGKVLTSDDSGAATWQTLVTPDLTGYATTTTLNETAAQLAAQNAVQSSQINDLNEGFATTNNQVQGNTTTIDFLQNQGMDNLIQNDIQSDQIATLNTVLSNTNGQVQMNTVDIAGLQNQLSTVQSNFVSTIEDPSSIYNVNPGNVGIGTESPSEKLDVNGNLRVRENAMIQGTSTANSFVKSGGTSSQFLMADGSVSEGILATIAAMQAQITALQNQLAGFIQPTLSTVTIGSQIWTSTNLNVTTYRDGTPIPEVQDPIAWANLTTGAWCHLNNDPANDAIYGKMYNHYAVVDPRGLAPVGYRVPTLAEWNVLFDNTGGWSACSPNLRSAAFNGNNNFGFGVLNGGSRSGDAQDSFFPGDPSIPAGTFDTYDTKFWCSDVLPAYNGVGMGDFSSTFSYSYPNNLGFYVRLLKN